MWNTTSKSVSNNGQVQVRFTSSASYSTLLTALVKVGTLTRTFKVTTRAEKWFVDGILTFDIHISQSPLGGRPVTFVYKYATGTPFLTNTVGAKCFACRNGDTITIPSPGTIPSDVISQANGTYMSGYAARPNGSCSTINEVQFGKKLNTYTIPGLLIIPAFDRLVCR